MLTSSYRTWILEWSECNLEWLLYSSKPFLFEKYYQNPWWWYRHQFVRWHSQQHNSFEKKRRLIRLHHMLHECAFSILSIIPWDSWRKKKNIIKILRDKIIIISHTHVVETCHIFAYIFYRWPSNLFLIEFISAKMKWRQMYYTLSSFHSIIQIRNISQMWNLEEENNLDKWLSSSCYTGLCNGKVLESFHWQAVFIRILKGTYNSRSRWHWSVKIFWILATCYHFNKLSFYYTAYHLRGDNH